MSKRDYQNSTDYYDLLDQISTELSPSEIHGILCGFICSDQNLHIGFGLNQLLLYFKEYANMDTSYDEDMILKLYQDISRQLMTQEEHFDLMLPKEYDSLTQQAQALSHWCQGFLLGLSSPSQCVFSPNKLSNIIFKSLQSIVQISQADFQNVTIEEKNQFTYEEAQKFIAKMVPLIYQAFHNPAILSENTHMLQ